jgi:predicted nucleic acid-binding protein
VVYFDTSLIVPYLLPEATSNDGRQFLSSLPSTSLAVSHWTRLEFSSFLAREVRMGGLSQEAAQRADAQFETVVGESFIVLTPSRADFDLARHYLQRYESGLRSGDALHLAIGANNGAKTFYSLDRGLLRAAEYLGLPASSGIRLPGRARR